MFNVKWKKHLAALMAVVLMGSTSVTADAAPADATSKGPALKVVEEASESTAMALAKALVGEDVEVVSAKMEGDAASFGSFSGAESIVGFADGLVISSGLLKNYDTDIFGGGDHVFFSNQTSGVGFSGADVEGFDPNNYFYDYTMLEFSYIPVGENVSFQYCVASEEYPEFISSFFDQFVLLVNGVNYALVPETGELVTIGTVNHNNNSVYYKGQNMEYNTPISETNFVFDGMTTTFSVSAKVTPGEENTIRMAIADKGDQIYDSAVFIKAGSVKEKEATPGEITVGAVDGDTLVLDRVDGADGFVGVDVTFEDINKKPISTESVTFNDGETSKDITIPEGTVSFFMTATAGGVTVDAENTTSQTIEKYEEKTKLSVLGKVIAVLDIFEVVEEEETVSSGDATVSGGDVTVSGGDVEVEPEDPKDPEGVAGATVTLKGNGISRTTSTDENGNFAFNNMKAGFYQVNATKDGKVSNTVVKLIDSNVECTLELHKGSSVVDTGDTGIMVGGLDALLGDDSPILDADDKAVMAAGGSVDVKFKAGKADAEDVAALEAFAGKTFDKVYDFSISKTAVDKAGEALYTKGVSETGKLIDIVMPMADNMKGLTNYTVYRAHDGEAPVAITETPNADGEYIEVFQKEGYVVIHACKFSAYTSVVGEVVENDPPVDKEESKDNGSSKKDEAPVTSTVVSPKTGEADMTMFWSVMAVMLLAAVVFGKKSLVKKN